MQEDAFFICEFESSFASLPDSFFLIVVASVVPSRRPIICIG